MASGGGRRVGVVLALAAVAAVAAFSILSSTTGSDEPAANGSDRTEFQADEALPLPDVVDEFPGPSVVGPDDGPIFTEGAEWSFLARTTKGLIVVDLATGERRTEESILRHPILATRDHVVYGQTQTGALHTAPLSDLTQSERMPGNLLATRSALQNHVWVISESSDLPSRMEYSLVDVDSLQVVRQVSSTIVRSSFSRLDARSWVSPEIATSPAGGAYELLSDGSYRRFSAGTVETHGYGLVLLETCDEALSCEFQWVDAATKSTLGRPVPESGTGPFMLAGGGEWLVDVGSGSRITNTLTGRVIDLGSRPTESISFTPDGRFAAYRREGGTVLEFMDTLTGDTKQLKGLQLLSMASNGVFPPGVFAPTDSLDP